MEKSDFKIGQKVYLKINKGSNAARYISKDEVNNFESWINEKVVTKIGKNILRLWIVQNLHTGKKSLI